MARFINYRNVRPTPNSRFDLVDHLQGSCAAMWVEIVQLKSDLYAKTSGLKFSLRNNDRLRKELAEYKDKCITYQKLFKEHTKPCKCVFPTEKSMKRIDVFIKESDENEHGFIFLQPSQLKRASCHNERDSYEPEQLFHAGNGPAKPLDVNGDEQKVPQVFSEGECTEEARTPTEKGVIEANQEETDELQVSSQIPEAHSPWSRLSEAFQSVKKYMKSKC